MTPTPDLWALFLFFGMPFVLGLLGLHRGGQILSGAYWGVEREDEVLAELDPGPTPRNRSRRERAVIGGALLVGGVLLVLQSARWLWRLL